MYCLQCGSPIDNDAEFCPVCGTKVAAAPNAPTAPVAPTASAQPAQVAAMPAGQLQAWPVQAPAPEPPKKSRTGLIVGIIAAVAVIAVVLILVFGGFGGQSGNASSSASASSASSASASAGSAPASAPSASAGSASTSTSASASAVPVVGEGGRVDLNGDIIYEFPGVVVTIPAKYAAMGVTCKYSHEACALVHPDSQMPLGTLVWGETAKHGNEIQVDGFDKGFIVVDGARSSASFYVPYLDDQGHTYYLGADKRGDKTATEIYLQLPSEQVAMWVQTVDDPSVANSASANSSTAGSNQAPSAAPTGVSDRKTPFWGVWISASKDLDEAVATANEAWGKGFEAQVFMTTDWSNLNSEPWYVVSVGCFDSEADATALVAKAESAGYSGAYAKHSGDYQG